jgi:hypothetical protein
MERPNKEDYDFNDVFEGARFASNMIKYADYLEAKQLPIHVVSISRAQEYAEFVVMCEREGRPLLLIQDYLKHY